MSKNEQYDAIVVGSGISGGWAAKELTERGLRVLVLEAGRPTNPAQDYVEHVQAWELPFRGRGNRAVLEKNQPVQKLCYACDEWSGKFFVNDLENPYTTPADKPFHWIRGRQVGGRSLTWGRQVYRWSDLDFEANAKDGYGCDWPIRYADIAPWYDHVERFIGVSGQKEGMAAVPDGQFLPPMELRCSEQHVRDKLMKAYKGERVVTVGRVAILTQDHGGRAACHYCGPCERGCITGSYFSSLSSTLPAAQATGRLTLRPFSVVESVLYDAKTRKATGVRVIDASTMKTIEFKARIVFLCASALESTRLLLNSAHGEFPGGLGSSSNALGKYLMDHTMGNGAQGTIPGYEKHRSYGNRPNGIYLIRYANVKEQHPDFLRGYAYQGGGWRGGVEAVGIGAKFKEQLLKREQGPWTFSLDGRGEMLPLEKNFVALDPNVKDKWGVPALRITCEYGDNEKAQWKHQIASAVEMLEAAGATNISTFNSDNWVKPGLVIHEMGTARMGRDPKTSVLNGTNQVWDAKNVFVTDGACMTSCAFQNPSITYMALTARAAASAVEQMKRNEL
jgi:choline dehydrogenase-like flavoprotein